MALSRRENSKVTTSIKLHRNSLYEMIEHKRDMRNKNVRREDKARLRS